MVTQISTHYQNRQKYIYSALQRRNIKQHNSAHQLQGLLLKGYLLSADVSLCLVSVSLHTFLHNQNNLKCLGYASWEGLSSKFKGFSINLRLMKSSQTLSRDTNRSHILLHNQASRLQNSIALTDIARKEIEDFSAGLPRNTGKWRHSLAHLQVLEASPIY